MPPSPTWGDVLAAYQRDRHAPLAREALDLAERRGEEAFAVIIEAKLELAACRELRGRLA